MLAQRNLDLHARVGIVPQHLDHPTDRLGELGGLLDEFDRHHLPRCRLFAARSHQDVLRQTLVFGHHQQHAMLVQHTPDDAGVGAFEDLDNLALWPAAAILAGLGFMAGATALAALTAIATIWLVNGVVWFARLHYRLLKPALDPQPQYQA